MSDYASYFDQDLQHVDLDDRHWVELRKYVPKKVTRILLSELRRSGAMGPEGVKAELSGEQGDAIDNYNSGLVVAFIASWNFEAPDGGDLPITLAGLDEIPEIYASRIAAEVAKIRAGRSPQEERDFPANGERVPAESGSAEPAGESGDVQLGEGVLDDARVALPA